MIEAIQNANVLLSTSAHEMAHAHEKTAITVNHSHLAAAVNYLQVELNPEQAIHLAVRTQYGHVTTEPPLRKMTADTPYIIGDRLYDNSPEAWVTKGQVENDLILEGVINGDWSNPSYTDSVLQKLQESQRRRSLIQAIANAAGSAVLMGGSVIGGTILAKQTGDAELARAATSGGVLTSLLYFMGLSLVRPAIHTRRRAEGRQDFIGMGLPLIQTEPPASAPNA